MFFLHGRLNSYHDDYRATDYAHRLEAVDVAVFFGAKVSDGCLHFPVLRLSVWRCATNVCFLRALRGEFLPISAAQPFDVTRASAVLGVHRIESVDSVSHRDTETRRSGQSRSRPSPRLCGSVRDQFFD